MQSAAEAIADLPDGATIALTGFGTSAGIPSTLVVAARHKGVKNLTVVANSLGAAGEVRAQMLVQNRQVRTLMTAFSSRPGIQSPSDEQIDAGEIEVELVPQGTLVERLRAGGAGVAAVYIKTGVGTPIADGKELRYFDGEPYILEHAIKVDYTFARGHRADRLGNVEFRGSNIHFNLAMAKAARVTIVEVDEIVEVGEIPPERIGLPGIFVTRVVRSTVPVDPPKGGGRIRRPADVPRTYNGKPGWTRHEIARRVVELIPDGSYVNLGSGMPTLISSCIAGRDIVLHGENGILGHGAVIQGDEADPDVFNASTQTVAVQPGASFFDSVTAFEMGRGGRLDAVVLGAYQVDAEGNLANYSTGDVKKGGIGGAMDLIAGGSTLIIMMEHRDSKGRPKLVEHTRYPLTGAACVDVVVTDLAVLRRTDGAWVLERVADGFTPAEVVNLTETPLRVAPELLPREAAVSHP
jgi:3-oxoacid CoA-transferase